MSKEESKKEKCVLDWLNRYPDWSPLHIASGASLERYILKESQSSDWEVLCSQVESEEGKTPLHIAAEEGNDTIVEILLKKGCDISKLNIKGENCIHGSCRKGYLNCIIKMYEYGDFGNNINVENESGETPLHLALYNGNVEVVEYLLLFKESDENYLKIKGFSKGPILEYGRKIEGKTHEIYKCFKLLCQTYPELINEQVDKDGNNILHLTNDKNYLQSLLFYSYKNENVDIDLTNRNNLTPLHKAIVNGNLSKFITLYSYGASIEKRDNNGDTPLHYGVRNGNLDIIKALLCFNANVKAKNNNGESIRHILKKTNSQTKDIIEKYLNLFENKETIQDHSDELERFEQSNALAYQLAKDNLAKKHSVNVLSLDGGGVRGMVIIQTLLYISKNLGNNDLIKNFDWISGTSTGAILAAGLAEGMSIVELQKLYLRFKDTVFVGDRPYDSDNLKNILIDVFGNRTMNQFNGNKKVIITTVQGNICPPKLNLFRNYMLPNFGEEINKKRGFFQLDKVPIWKALRCSTAAPTYFEAVDNKYIDGGVMANNPTMDTIADIQLYNTALNAKNQKPYEISCVLSIGTGKVPQKVVENINVNVPSGIADVISTARGILNLKNILIEQITAADGEPVNRGRSWAHSMKSPFFRFSPPFTQEIDLDCKDDKVIINMLWETEIYLRGEGNCDILMLVGFLENFRK
uniref:phospholipase A2 n=1 Tax=Parastrongyloides trichosuri TaxID=131310 RepID=A0A0N4ZRA5_PARTI